MTAKRGGNPGASEPATLDVPPLQRDIRSPGTWRYLASYVLLGASALLIIMEISEIIASRMWRTSGILGVSLLSIVFAMWNIARLRGGERKAAEPLAAHEVAEHHER